MKATIARSAVKAPHSRVVILDPRDVKETAENYQVYRRDDPSFIELRASIARDGVTTPVEISKDHYVISGHRRRLAAELEGKQLPCIIDGVVMAELSSPERVQLLVSRNLGIRVKTDVETYLEAAAAVDPEQAIREAEERRVKVFNKVKTSFSEVQVTGGIRRTDPSGERSEFLQAILGILERKRADGYLPTSERHIHYSLLPLRVKTSKRNNGHVYGVVPAGLSNEEQQKVRNVQRGLLSKILTDARSKGLIDPDDIDDMTRPTSEWAPDGNMGTYVSRELEGFLKGYLSPIHREQDVHLELLVEKNTIYPLISKHVADKYRLPVTSMRGYGSYPAARDVAQRYSDSGKAKLVVIYISDLDPEGLDMAASWKKYLQHDFGVEASVFRAAVTPEQVHKYNLPPDTDVKLTSTRAAKFVAEHGSDCWELDGMPEAALINEISTAVESVLDMAVFSQAIRWEQQADIKLAHINAAVRRFVTEHFKKELAL